MMLYKHAIKYIHFRIVGILILDKACELYKFLWNNSFNLVNHFLAAQRVCLMDRSD